MAQLTHTDPDSAAARLDRAFRAWERLPDVLATIDDWPEDEAAQYLDEWGIEVVNLAVLEQFRAERKLSPAESRRLDELLALVARSEPLLDELFNGPVRTP